MHRQNNSITSRYAKLLALLCMLIVMALPAQAQKKVTIVCDWDFAPYEFLNSKGKPDGYNIELLCTILDRLNVSYEFVMKARKQNIAIFWNHEADLIIDYRNRYMDPGMYRTRTPMGYYRVVAAHKNEKQAISHTHQLAKNGTVVFNSTNDSISYSLLGDLADSLDQMDFQSPRTALSGIGEGLYDFFIWGEQPMKWKIKEYNVENISCDLLEDLKPTEIHVVGYDKHLIDNIDNMYVRMQQSGEIDQLNDKWFHPEMIEEKASPIVIYIALAVLLLTVLILFTYRITRSKVKAALRRNNEMEEMMHQALNMGNFTVFTIDLRHGRVYNQHGHVLPEGGITMQEMMQYIHPDDQAKILERRHKKNAAHQQATPLTLRWNDGTPENPHWIDVIGYSYPEFNKHHKPVSVVIASRDVSEEKKREQEDRDMASHFFKMFESTLLAMSFYDKDGHLLDLNDKMRELCGISDQMLDYFKTVNLFDAAMVKDVLTPGTTENFHVCQHMYYPNIGLDKYAEMRVWPALDADGNVMYYIITARDISEEREMYRELRSQSMALKEAEKSNRGYESELRTMLENCNMYVWHTDIKTGIISFSRSLHNEEFTETLEEYANGMYEDHRQEAIKNIRNIREFKKPFNTVHHFHHTPVTDRPTWFSVSGMPLLDAEGNVTQLFGIVRDVTELMEAQEKLKEETARAENSAMLKSTFLANMTHEIRTPLNAIVGFSDILQMIDTPDERKEFIRIIHNNCDMLMRLVNDIFEASTMDIKPLEIVPREVDFAAEFNVVCQSLSQRVQEPGVEFVVDSPKSSFRTVLDMGRMQQVITNFVTNAVKYTHQGHIRVGWKVSSNPSLLRGDKEGSFEPSAQRAEGIYMYCEDTGAGIPKEKQKKVFDRFVKLNDFVQGTGLGLSICKSIAERSGGSIGVNSEGDGTGSTFWIWVPCHQIA